VGQKQNCLHQGNAHYRPGFQTEAPQFHFCMTWDFGGIDRGNLGPRDSVKE
jgi:hypothetical protein